MKTLKQLLLGASLLLSTGAYSQYISFGAKGGVSANSFSQFATQNTNLGYQAFLFGTYSTHENYGYSLDLGYTYTGGFVTRDFESGDITREVGLAYLSMTPRLVFFGRDVEDDFRPKLSFGPSAAFLIAAHDENRESDLINQYKRFNWGLTLGTGFNYRIAPSLWLNADVDYALGLMDVLDVNRTTPTNAYTNGLSASLGIAVGLSRVE
jgi:hypothetical protein